MKVMLIFPDFIGGSLMTSAGDPVLGDTEGESKTRLSRLPVQRGRLEAID